MKKTNQITAGTLRIKLLPGFALKGITGSKNVYYPYFAAGIFSVFTYFVFSSILKNDIISILPKSAYAWIMLELGKWILSIILLLFLIYANSILIKRRQKEFGLYNILGLEKKHIGVIMFFETLFLYIGVLGGGIVIGLVLSKLMFLILLKICRLPAEIQFVFEPEAFRDTLIYFGTVYILNFCGSLWQIGRSKPVELMSGARKGEKEPRFLWFYAVLGMLILGGGYYLCVTVELDSMIFISFFLAAFLIVLGTYLLFTSGSVAFLKWIRSRKALYYKPKNFVTISGMFYRMKKNAAGLSNICIFSTMAVITLICTVALCIGMEECTHFMYPYDITLGYEGEKISSEDLMEEIYSLQKTYDVEIQRADLYEKITLPVRKEADRFLIRQEQYSDMEDYAEDYQFDILLSQDYNRIADRSVSLSDDEVLIFSSGRDYGYDRVDFYGKMLSVKEELSFFYPQPKAQDNTYNARYTMVVKDAGARDLCVEAWCRTNGIKDTQSFLNSEKQYVQILLEGSRTEKSGFLEKLAAWGKSKPGFSGFEDGMDRREDLQVTYGALLFIGILFGLIFFMCLILIMYYKQITEGYEDRNNFDIMQKVGMSNPEIHAAVHRQILTVFALPLIGAVLHTIAGMFMVRKLLGVVSLFNKTLLFSSTAGVIVIFSAVYIISYLITARTYYGIVAHSEAH